MSSSQRDRLLLSHAEHYCFTVPAIPKKRLNQQPHGNEAFQSTIDAWIWAIYMFWTVGRPQMELQVLWIIGQARNDNKGDSWSRKGGAFCGELRGIGYMRWLQRFTLNKIKQSIAISPPKFWTSHCLPTIRRPHGIFELLIVEGGKWNRA